MQSSQILERSSSGSRGKSLKVFSSGVVEDVETKDMMPGNRFKTYAVELL